MTKSAKQPLATTARDGRKAWVSPKVGRVNAGEAESGAGIVTEGNAGSS